MSISPSPQDTICSLKQLFTPPPFHKWNNADLALYQQGARIGDCFNGIDLTIIGYTQSGFYILSTDEHRVQYRHACASQLWKKLLKTTAPRFLLSQDRIRPAEGRELDFLCTVLKITNTRCHSTSRRRAPLYIVACPCGHHRSSTATLQIPTTCSDECQSYQSDEAQLLWYILNTTEVITVDGLERNNTITQTHIPTGYQLRRRLAALSGRPIEDIRPTSAAISCYKPGTPVVLSDIDSYLETWVRPLSGIKSGAIYTLRDWFLRAHQRKCGNIHWEISKTPIFPAQSLQLSDFPHRLGHCAICNTANEYISPSTTQSGGLGPYTTIQTHSVPKPARVVVWNNHIPAMIIGRSQSNRTRLLTKHGREVYVRLNDYTHKIRPASNNLTSEFIKQTTDRLGFFKARKWPKNIIPGARLKTNGQSVIAKSSPYYNKQLNKVVVDVFGHLQCIELEQAQPDVDIKLKLQMCFKDIQNHVYTICSIDKNILLVDEAGNIHTHSYGDFLAQIYMNQLQSVPSNYLYIRR